MTPREFAALKAVHDASLKRWAMTQATFCNAHFRGKGEPAFEPEHFLGTKQRLLPRPQTVSERLDVMRANSALLKLNEEQVPAWAKGLKEDLCPVHP